MHRPSVFQLVLSWALVALWAIFIFAMSAHTGSDFSHGEGLVASIRHWLDDMQAVVLGDGIDVVSPVAHFTEYAIFGALMQFALRASGAKRRTLLFAIVLCALYAMTDEIHQAFVPDRACDPVDWVVDTVGASVGAAIGSWVLARNES